MSEQEKYKFNKFCAVVMGYDIKPSKKESSGESSLFCTREAKDDTSFERFVSKIGFYYRPYDDLNQMSEVIDKLMLLRDIRIETMVNQPHHVEQLFYAIIGSRIKQGFRNFIISTMDEDNDS